MAQPLRDPEEGRAYFQAPDQDADSQHRSVAAMGNGDGIDGVEGHVQAPEVEGRHSGSAAEKAAGRSELYAYHPEHDPVSYLDFPQESIEGSPNG
ncbi:MULTISPECIES: hypothetical protein [unclassified Ensifer]|uniref:hypothetical protein n=1 Tax=unclassified Ensifer TaxID=2633371 RepID=UPI000813BBC8|nr:MULTISPECIES: hypothetical protein [unclassified Ensifer]OCO99023.1 hypothetical protein BC362_27740 [Ensifer sp. LC14]OCP11356.1 hypothetical protein BC374_16930 [Ensifer sp. LC13]OCP12001.1 hypothetical protein BBX50_17390 [Ensifer sp. LC11]OCP33510.1 hypothetical protein BC364_16285 [Ensifer sp. LC499]